MPADFPDHAQLANLALLEELYKNYLAHPESVDPSWRYFFEGIDFAGFLRARPAAAPVSGGDLCVYQLIEAYRRFGHLKVPINPISLTLPPSVPELALARFGLSSADLGKSFSSFGLCKTESAQLSEIIAALEAIYCARIGFEYVGFGDSAIEQWIQSKIEPALTVSLSLEEKKRLLQQLNQSELFEAFIHTKYAGQKRFSVEGLETLIPLLDTLIEEGARCGLDEFFFGMAHRGRLNVLANILNKPYAVIFREFEDTFYPLASLEGSGDVKYHKGFSSRRATSSQKEVTLHLAPNPSHLETVDAVAMGEARAREVMRNSEGIALVLMHGDLAVAGQGIVYETMQMLALPGYAVGGTIHIVTNNQVGFTTSPAEGYSTHYCTDIAKAFNAPIFHVNAEDPESCLYVAKLAIALRQQFHCDVFIDLNGYRKYGHNEGDEPFFTQPLEYAQIRQKKPIRELYRDQLLAAGDLEQSMAQALEEDFKAKLASDLSHAKDTGAARLAPEEALGHFWKQYAPPPGATLLDPLETKVPLATLQTILDKCAQIPAGFHLNAKLQKLFETRQKMLNTGVDWATAELLAFGSLLLDGVHVRLSGEDCQRGTFSHRHMAWVDQENGQKYFPLSHLKAGQPRCDILNSPLSEYAVLGFEYGYSSVYQNALVLWEAQYGDFVNGAQIVIDQFIASAEQKWFRTSSVVLLLPHGMEGAGPEHSSCRVERFLQLAANDNMQIAIPSTPAQYFHLLRRQALRPLKKPLIIPSPKSLLRAPACQSPASALTQGTFEELLDDPRPPSNAKRLLFCTGHVFYDLLAEREKRKSMDTALLRVEQLYPFHTKKAEALFAKYKNAARIAWVQEEPKNMGPWEYIQHPLQTLLGDKPLHYVGREPSASPATGSPSQHQSELKTLLDEAFQ